MANSYTSIAVTTKIDSPDSIFFRNLRVIDACVTELTVSLHNSFSPKLTARLVHTVTGGRVLDGGPTRCQKILTLDVCDQNVSCYEHHHTEAMKGGAFPAELPPFEKKWLGQHVTKLTAELACPSQPITVQGVFPSTHCRTGNKLNQRSVLPSSRQLAQLHHKLAYQPLAHLASFFNLEIDEVHWPKEFQAGFILAVL